MKNRCTVLILISFIIWGCKKSNTELQRPMSTINHNVTLQEAKKLAILSASYPNSIKRLLSHNRKKSMNARQSEGSTKKIKSSLSVNFSQPNPSFYIFNYESGGFSIVAGDDRIYPIMAYSNKNAFPISENKIYPSGLVGWLSETDEMVKYIRDNHLKQQKNVAAAWNNMTIKSKIVAGTYSINDLPPCLVDGDQTTDIETYGPYTTTTWGQGVGYNNSLSNKGCSAYSNGKPPVGCVATATAQIMAFYQYPTTLSWSLMPDNSPSSYTADLMADIGQNVGMDYDCDGSGAKTKKAASALKNDYGYSSASYHDYDYYQIYSNLLDGKPAIISGGRKDKWWFFNVYADGHAWVCDGVRSLNVFVCHVGEPDEDPNVPTERHWDFLTGNMYFNMNWGWNGNYNGWFVYTNFNPGNNTFNYKKKMITNITP